MSDIKNEIGDFTVLFTSRLGGISRAPYDEKNLAFHVGDRPQDVIENRRIVIEGLGVDPCKLTCGQQVHGQAVKVVGVEDVGMGALWYESAHPATDAMVTDLTDVPIAVFVADCVPIVMCDRGRGAAAVTHAGWKGTLADVTSSTLRTMEEAYGTEPSDVEVFIGPHIMSCCYDVGEALAERFANEISPNTVKDSRFLDLQIANFINLARSGTHPSKIHTSEICTSCTSDRFFSYRKSKMTGRQAAIVLIS